MEFTYDAYDKFLKEKKEEGFSFLIYDEYLSNKNKYEKVIILRHDVDISLEKALELAKIENANNIRSTYFFLLTSNFYNIFSKNVKDIIFEIISLNHNIGLHFDETQYDINSIKDFIFWLDYERKLLEKIINREVNVFSNHRPSKLVLNGINLNEYKILNAYQKEFFVDMKYLSDSRMYWRDKIEETFNSGKFKSFQVLTHGFWYDKLNSSLKDRYLEYINSHFNNIYDQLYQNTSNFSEIISKSEYFKTFNISRKEINYEKYF